MDTGLAIFPTHDAIAPAAMARLAEERGHESLFFPEHTHIPASRESAWPGGSDLPRRYRAAELRARADRPVGLMVMGAPADAKVLEAYAAAGFRRAVHWLPSAPRGPVERALDRYEAAVAEFNGE